MDRVVILARALLLVVLAAAASVACAAAPPRRRHVEWRRVTLTAAATPTELLTVFTPRGDWDDPDDWSFEAALGQLAGRWGVGVTRAASLREADAVVLRGVSGAGCARGAVWSLPADRRVAYLDPRCLPDPWETRAAFEDAASLATGRKP